AGHELDVVPLRRVALAREELRRDTGRGLEPVARAAREAHRVDHRKAVADHARRSAAHVDVQGDGLSEREDGAARRALLVLGDTYLKAREVDVEPALRVDLCHRLGVRGVVRGPRTSAHAVSEARMALSVAMRTATVASISAVSMALLCARSVADAWRMACECAEIDSVLTGKPM